MLATLRFYLSYYMKNKIYLINNVIFIFGSAVLLQWVLDDPQKLKILMPSVLWLFSWLGLFMQIPILIAADKKDGTLDQLQLLTCGLETVLFARLVAAWLNAVGSVSMAALLCFLYAGVPLAMLPAWIAGIALALFAALAIGLFISAILADLGEQAALAALLAIPFYSVLLIFGGRYVQNLQAGSELVSEPLLLLGLLALVIVPLSIVLCAMLLRDD